jgi:hypothetical protein
MNPLWLRTPHRRFALLLSVLLGIEFTLLAVALHDRKDWALLSMLATAVLNLGFAARLRG